MSLIRKLLSLLLYTINTIFWFVPIFICGLIKLLPIPLLQKAMSLVAKWCANKWVACNSPSQNLIAPYRPNVSGLDELKPKDWYLVIANHQVG